VAAREPSVFLGVKALWRKKHVILVFADDGCVAQEFVTGEKSTIAAGLKVILFCAKFDKGESRVVCSSV
jgi:hypothetical protein